MRRFDVALNTRQLNDGNQSLICLITVVIENTTSDLLIFHNVVLTNFRHLCLMFNFHYQ